MNQTRSSSEMRSSRSESYKALFLVLLCSMPPFPRLCRNTNLPLPGPDHAAKSACKPVQGKTHIRPAHDEISLPLNHSLFSMRSACPCRHAPEPRHFSM